MALSDFVGGKDLRQLREVGHIPISVYRFWGLSISTYQSTLKAIWLWDVMGQKMVPKKPYWLKDN